MAGRFGFDFAFDAIAVSRGGLAPGVYASNSEGNLTYIKTGSTEFSGVTFDSTYDIYWFEILADGTKTDPALWGNFALLAGQNTPITITGVESSATVVMYLADSVVIDPSRDGQFTFIKSDIGNVNKTSGTISGGAWSDTLPSPIVNERIDISYTGTFTPPEGDYEHRYLITDPNGVETLSTPITVRWAPHVFITSINGNANMRDPQPTLEGVVSVNAEYIKQYNVLTDGDQPQYDASGEVQYIDGGQLISTVLVIDPITDTVTVKNVSDDFGNLRDSDSVTINRNFEELYVLGEPLEVLGEQLYV